MHGAAVTVNAWSLKELAGEAREELEGGRKCYRFAAGPVASSRVREVADQSDYPATTRNAGWHPALLVILPAIRRCAGKPR